MVHTTPYGGIGVMMAAAAILTGGIMIAAFLAEGSHRINGGDVVIFSFLVPTALLMAIAMGVSWLILQAVVGSITKRY
jgi:hypothetical protein